MTKKTSFRLGRGLSSLISLEVEPASPAPPPPADGGRFADNAPASQSSDSSVPSGSRLMQLEVEQIRPNPHQPRRDFEPVALAQLAASLAQSGLIQPIVVRSVPGGFELIAGERRLRAAKQAGLRQVPAVVREADPVGQAELALIENIQREDLNPMERAAAYRALLDKLTVTQAELATRLGEDRSSIANFVRLLDLPAPVQHFVRERKLTLGHAKLIAGISDPAEQQRLAELAVQQGLSVQKLQQLIAESLQSPGATARPAASSAHLADLERTITQQLGLRVQLRRGGKGKGRVVIHYASLEQFDDLLARLSIQLAE